MDIGYPNLSVKVHSIEIKKAIRKQNLPDPFFLNVYSTSPYSSCQHGCVYCDGRAEKYHLEGNFERDITSRINLPKILDTELGKLREIAPISIGSGITDVYQPVEKSIKLTQQCSETLLKYNFPVSILTKSALIMRDIENWKAVNDKSQFLLQMTITTLNDKEREIFEPNASPIDERLQTIKSFKERGIPVGVFMMPLLPGITDTEENIIPLLEKLKELNVDFIMPGFLTLRPGRQKDYYIQVIKKHYPHLLGYYNDLFRKPLVSGSPSYHYRNRYKSRYNHLFNDIPIEAPHYLYKGKMPVYQEIYLLLAHMKSIYRRRNINIEKLNLAFEKYTEWINEQKKYFNRRRSLHANYIDEQLKFMLTCEQFDEIIRNEKLIQFLKDVIIKDKEFDYKTLKLKIKITNKE